MTREELLEEYNGWLCSFCKHSAYLEKVQMDIENGKKISEKELSEHLFFLSKAKEKILSLKEELGFGGGIDFTDDCNFAGFSYKGGRLEGDYTKLPDIILPWIRELDEETYYQYEVGTLILFHYMTQQIWNKRHFAKQKLKNFIKDIFHIVKGILLFLLGIRKEELVDEC